jgi:hypothetical protein
MELTNIHECLKAAQYETNTVGPLDDTLTLRIQELLKQRSSEICERNKTNLSTYLRKCCEALVADYGAAGK